MRIPGRRDLMGWTVFVSALAPNGISVEDISASLLETSYGKLSGAVGGGEVREGRRYVDLTFHLIAHHQDAEIKALRLAAPVFAAHGMPIERVELQTCEP